MKDIKIPDCLVVQGADLAQDPQLAGTTQVRGKTGYRKLVVTNPHRTKEEIACEREWRPPSATGPCPVAVDTHIEVSRFTDERDQERHYHPIGSEVYFVITGAMSIWVKGEIHEIEAGGMIYIPPMTIHEVLQNTSFQAWVVTSKPHGSGPKVIVER